VPVVVWIGNWGNAFYLGTVLRALEEAARRAPFVLRLVGGADIHDVRSESLDIEYCDWRKEKEADWLTSADVGIMPLVDSEYERGKCSFKIIQYMSAGLPVMASPVGMNAAIVTPEVGLLARTDDEWTDGLVRLVGNAELRSTMAAASRQTYLRDYRRGGLAKRLSGVLRGSAHDG
jgi:glycosyltransferase involved in cell wall biosynthesis